MTKYKSMFTCLNNIQDLRSDIRGLLTHRGSSPLRLQKVSIHSSGPEAVPIPAVYPGLLDCSVTESNSPSVLRSPTLSYSLLSLLVSESVWKCLLFDHQSDSCLGGWLYSLSPPSSLL